MGGLGKWDDDDDYLDFIGATIPLETIYRPTPISI